MRWPWGPAARQSVGGRRHRYASGSRQTTCRRKKAHRQLLQRQNRRAARRRSTIVTVFASLQTRIANFTLANMRAEVERWTDTGISLFQNELDAMKANLPPPS